MAQAVESLMKTTMENIKNMIDVNAVIGDAVETKDGAVLIPISKVCFAFVTGGGELTQKNSNAGDAASNGEPFAGGTGAGVSVHPIGFLATTNGQLRMLPVHYNNAVDKIIDLVPNFIENIENLISKKGENKKEESNS